MNLTEKNPADSTLAASENFRSEFSFWLWQFPA